MISNLDKVVPDRWAMKGLAAALLPHIQEFYTHEENVRAFGEWLQEQENHVKDSARLKRKSRKK